MHVKYVIIIEVCLKKKKATIGFNFRINAGHIIIGIFNNYIARYFLSQWAG